VKAVLREITNMSAIRDRSVVRSSVIPSAKYCWSRSSLRLVKGSTTIERRGATAARGIDKASGSLAAGKSTTASGRSV